jgi:hypothetical protein
MHVHDANEDTNNDFINKFVEQRRTGRIREDISTITANLW